MVIVQKKNNFMRKCKTCDFKGNKEDFPLANIINEKKYYRHFCNKCYNKKKKKYKKDRHKEFLKYKDSLKCSKCGFDEHPCALDFHHTEDNKEFNIGNLSHRGASMKKLMKEVEKCVVLCANCHRIQHFKNKK